MVHDIWLWLSETVCASNFQAFVKRSQGLQLYRDAMYNLCQSYLNHAIDSGKMEALSKEILTTSVGLIKDELILTDGNINPPPQQQQPAGQSLPQIGNRSGSTGSSSTPRGEN